MVKQWLANQVIGAVFLLRGILIKRFSKWVLKIAPLYREKERAVWWALKLKSLLTPDDEADDDRANALGILWKFEHPPKESGWALGDDGIYYPGPGSRVRRLHNGQYEKIG